MISSSIDRDDVHCAGAFHELDLKEQVNEKVISYRPSSLVDVRQSPRYASLKAETGVRFP